MQRNGSPNWKYQDTVTQDLHQLHTFIVEHFEYTSFPMLQEVPECAQKHSSVSLYFTSKKALENYKQLIELPNKSEISNYKDKLY